MSASREQSSSEERANALSHAAGLLLAAAGLPVLLGLQRGRLGAAASVGAIVFCGTMLLLYLASMLYHACAPGTAKRWFARVDHAVIYLFIAGTYTAFVLHLLRGRTAWLLFGGVWSIALLGFASKLLDRLDDPRWSTGLYVACGWLAVGAAAPFVVAAPGAGLAWLMAGAVCYTVGAVVFFFDHRMRFGHCVWHLFVLGGSACHLVAVAHHLSATP